MINIFLALIVGSVTFTFFHLSTSINAINRIVLNTPIEIFETSVYLLDEQSDYLYFDKTKLEEKLITYYNTGLDYYVNDLSVNIYYFYYDGETFCVDDRCSYVKVDVVANLFLTYTYDRSMHYEIVGGYNG